MFYNFNGEVSTQQTLNTTSMDDLLHYCFLKSLTTSIKKVSLPLLTSNCYKLHILPACPKTETLDIKKTSFKKLSNFLEDMMKKGVIQVESLQKGVQSISKIDFSHELIRAFVDSYIIEEDASNLVVDKARQLNSHPPVREFTNIKSRYTVTVAVLPLFYFYDYKNKESVTSVVVRKVVTDYVSTRNLQNPVNKKMVDLDDVLRSVTKSPGEVVSLSWSQLLNQVFSQMGQSVEVELCSNVTKGKLPPVDILVATRTGNKKVTLVNNLELYGINLPEFARECQRGVATGATINHLPNARSAQLQIQGNQVMFLHKILTSKYHIPERCLRGLHNAPKRKK